MDRGAWQATIYGVAKSLTQLGELTLSHDKEHLWENLQLILHLMVRRYFGFKIRNKVRTPSPTTSTLYCTGGGRRYKKTDNNFRGTKRQIITLSLDDMILCRKS